MATISYVESAFLRRPLAQANKLGWTSADRGGRTSIKFLNCVLRSLHMVGLKKRNFKPVALNGEPCI
jgi:hypothetical protein